MKKKWIIGVSGMAAAVVLMAVAQDDAIPQLRAGLANLGLRVDRLEAGAGGANTGAAAASPAAASSRSMTLVSVHLSDHSGDNADEIADLKRQCSALMDTVNNHADASASDLGGALDNRTAWVRGGVNGWTGGQAGGGAAIADKQMENRYATLRANKQQKLEALQAAANKPLQIIMGHHNNVIIVLETKVDLSSSLNNIAVGDTVTWVGTRINADDNSETWRIDAINKAGS